MSNELLLDSRNEGDLCRRMEELARSYTPEWRFDREDPDVGSTLALIFANQMADNIRRLNQLPEKYHTEFVNLLGLSPQRAYPASGVVVVELMQGTVPGVALPSGSRLMADSGVGQSILFETQGDVYLTNARLTDILSISGTRGQIHPILGGPKPIELGAPREQETLLPPEEDVAENHPVGFSLFSYEEKGIEKNAMLLYHRTVFGTASDVPVLLCPVTPEGKSLAAELADGGKWRWSYQGEEGLIPFSSVEVRGDVLELRREEESKSVRVRDSDYHLICLEALGPVEESLTLGDLRMASAVEDVAPEAILHAGSQLEDQECMPLGSTVSLFDECYICDDRIFSQQDAIVTLSFHLSSKKKLLKLTAQQEKEELKIIKRKPRTIQYDTALTAPERVALEYFNGRLWRTLPCEGDWSDLLDGTHSGEIAIRFACPADWAPLPIDGYEGRSLRLRVTQADNCYLLPCEHTMPVWQDVRLSYAYESHWKQPQIFQTARGTQVMDQTRQLLNGEPVTAFQPLPYPAACLYLGFDRPLAGAPISLLFDVEENVRFRLAPVSFEYSTRTGFKPMKVVDGTGNFSEAGTVLFMPPSDHTAVEVEGVRRWWLRLRGEEQSVRGYHPVVRGIRLNAVEVQNRQSQMEENFHVEAAIPHMRFPLAAKNILTADVFISEQMSRYQMRKMLEEQPQDAWALYDTMGEIHTFFVRWTEVDHFDHSKPEDRHFMIDRMNSTLVFGDGSHVRLPQQGADIVVRPVSCDGSRGNVPAGTINSFYGNVMYVESVHNPSPTYAGSDLEDLDSTRRRGAELISGRGRLVSQLDFVRAVKAFSGSVEKVKCLAGVDIDGRRDHELITIAVMTRDYATDNHAFASIREPLRRQLLSRCDATVSPECLILAEPLYVEITLSVWVKAEAAARAFDIQNLILDSIRDFLDPISRPGHSGWEIGSLPSEGQLKMLLQSLRFAGHVERMVAVARYVDDAGAHEAALDQLPNSPFAIGINGKHRVYIEFQ